MAKDMASPLTLSRAKIVMVNNVQMRKYDIISGPPINENSKGVINLLNTEQSLMKLFQVII